MPIKIKREDGSISTYRNAWCIPAFLLIPEELLRRASREIYTLPRCRAALLGDRRVIEVIESDLFLATMSDIYAYMAREAANQNIDLFSNESREQFRAAQETYRRTPVVARTRRRSSGIRRMPLSDAPQELQEHILRLFCAPYNTLTDNGLCYLLPEYETMLDAMGLLRQNDIDVDEDQFTEVFSAISRYYLVNDAALCHLIRDEWRDNVVNRYTSEDYGILDFDALPTVVAGVLHCESGSSSARAWMSFSVP